MTFPDPEEVNARIEAVCPNPADQVYLDVLAITRPDAHVEDVLDHFFERDPMIPDASKPLAKRSPYSVSWHTGPTGPYRIVIVDHRHLATVRRSPT